jgi:type II secretory pathway component PulF
MAGLGERRGTLGTSLHQAAEMYRRQAELRAQLLRSVLPPFVIVFTAAVIAGFFVLAMFLPLIKLITSLSG